MRRFLIFIVLLYVVWRILNLVGRRMQRNSQGADAFSRFGRREPGRTASQRPQGEKLIACQRCGTLLPASRALPGPGGAVYCSDECRDRDAAEVGHGSADGTGAGA
jgi:hypothetical protein